MQYFTEGGSVMIDYEKLDALMELPVSEEMLGAYLEGNLHGSELREVQNIIEQDSFVADIISDTNDILQMNDELSNPWMEDSFSGGLIEDQDFQLLMNNDFALPEIIMDASLGIDENLIQDATLANLPSGLEEDTTHVGLNDGDNVNGINEANNEL